jgi:hypothetical protein
MPDPKPKEPTSEAESEADAEEPDADALRTRGDVQGLLALAKAYRAGTAPGGRDMKRCYEAYAAAADLGSAEASFAAALFHMTGGVVPQDWNEGASRLRSAAERGSVPAKIYLGNLYELGIHYKADREKADVWYRNAARGARIEAEEQSQEYETALAELGSARHVLARTAQSDLPETTKARLLARAKSHGYGLRQREADDPQRPTLENALEAASEATAPSVAATASPSERAAREPSQTSYALSAFAYATLFIGAGVGAAYAAALGARELVQHGFALPGIGARTHLVFPIVLALLGVFPSILVYRASAIVKGLAVAALAFGAGWAAWGTGRLVLHADRGAQALAFAIPAFLVGLLVAGLFGGTKRRPQRRR